MELFIKQKWRKYRVYKNSDNELLYVGQWSSTYFGVVKLTLSDVDGHPLLVVKHKENKLFQWAWKQKFRLILLKTNCEFEISSVKFFKSHWKMTDGETIYEYFMHEGHLKSIFMNNTQVAKVDKQTIQFFERDNIQVTCDDDVDALLLCGLVLTFDMKEGDNNNIITFNLGNIGPQARHFDYNWRPKRLD